MDRRGRKKYKILLGVRKTKLCEKNHEKDRGGQGCHF